MVSLVTLTSLDRTYGECSRVVVWFVLFLRCLFSPNYFAASCLLHYMIRFVRTGFIGYGELYYQYPGDIFAGFRPVKCAD